MKGLLLKDFYMITKYCRSYLLIAVVFTLVSVISPEASAFSSFLCLLAGMIPVTLMAYEERSRWTEYSGALPYSKAQIVSSKYVVGLLAQLAVMIFSLLIKTAVYGLGGVLQILTEALYGLAITCVVTAIIFPFIFWLGVEKGRVAYYIFMGAATAGLFVASEIFASDSIKLPEISDNALFLSSVAVPLAAVLYAVSCLISIAVYRKKEIV